MATAHRLALLLLPALLCGCLRYKEVELTAVHDIRIVSYDRGGVALRAVVQVRNPNGYRIKVMDPDVDLTLDGDHAGKGVLDTVVVLQRRSDARYSIPMHADFSGGGLVMVLRGLMRGHIQVGAKGTVVGKAGLLRRRFPFEMEERIDL